MLQPVLSVREAASYLRVRPRTIRDWIAAGRIMARKVGKSYIIPEEEISRMVAGSRESAEAGTGADDKPATPAEFRSLLRGGKQIDKDSIREQWDEDNRYERRAGKPR